MWQKETRKTQKHNSCQNVSFETRSRFAPPKITQNEIDKEVKNHKEKETSQYRHQISVYSNPDHRHNPVINNFPENNIFFWHKKTTPCETARKHS